MKLTNHSKERMKERCGFNKKSLDRMAEKAFYEGIAHAQTKGRLKKWVDKLYLTNRNANNIRLYGDKAYIFCNEVLVTVIQIPCNLVKDFPNLIKKNHIEKE